MKVSDVFPVSDGGGVENVMSDVWATRAIWDHQPGVFN